ncbi:MAG: DinB family protein [Dehalococcoidia bacterium]|nr:DinB family protein [Dehalococcoidia bacterium]
MTADVEAPIADLAQSRAVLLAAIEGVSPEAFVRPPAGSVTTSDDLDDARWSVRDILWHIGLLDDWFRLLIDQTLGGRLLAPWQPRMRPEHLETPDFLRAWLTQTRGALLARAHRLSTTDLDTEFAPPEGKTRTPRRLLARLVQHDLDHASQIRRLREGTH